MAVLISAEETDIEKLRVLCRRWNIAASRVGICGSEYIDDPERVFAQVRATRDAMMRALIRAKAQPPK